MILTEGNNLFKSGNPKKVEAIEVSVGVILLFFCFFTRCRL